MRAGEGGPLRAVAAAVWVPVAAARLKKAERRRWKRRCPGPGLSRSGWRIPGWWCPGWPWCWGSWWLCPCGGECADIDAVGMDSGRRGARMNAAVGERMADRSTLFVHLVRCRSGCAVASVDRELPAQAHLR